MHARLRKDLPAYPADLTAAGAVEQLLAAHRARFSDARMQDGDDGGDDDAGAGKDDASDGEDDDTGDDITDEEKAALADPGKQALTRTQAKFKAERDRRKQLEQELASLKSGKSDDGKDAPDPAAIRDQVRAELAAEQTRERLLDKIEAKAARAFADPDDAAALLLRGADIDDFLDADGKIDVGAIEDGLKALLEKKPYLGVAQGDKKRFQGGGDGGARKEQKSKANTLEEAVAQRIAAGSSRR